MINTQQVVFDEKAELLREHHLKRRWFNGFMRHILICACARRLRAGIVTRETNYLKHISFLCLKKEMAMNKHIRTKVKGKHLV